MGTATHQGAILLDMASVPAARHLLRAKDLADTRYFERLSVADLARAGFRDPSGNNARLTRPRT